MLEMLTNGALLAISLAILAVAARFTIKAVEDLIEITHLSEASAGFAILSVVTSVPEIFVAISSVIHGKPGLSVGDILGSNVFNIGIVIGILAVIGSLRTCCSEMLTELVDILFLSSLIPIVLVSFGFAGPFVGLALFGTFAFSIYTMTKKRSQPIKVQEKNTKHKPSKIKVLLTMLAGVACVLIAAEITVLSASNIADLLGIAPIIIGAKIVAIGTSLPELALDLTAVRRGRVQLAVGDAIGSNLTNISLVLGIVLTTSPFGAVNLSVFAQILPFVLITTLILWRYLTKGGVTQLGGIALILTYVVFQATLAI